MIHISVFKTVRNISYIETYTTKYVHTCVHLFMSAWTVHGWEMKKTKESTVSASKKFSLVGMINLFEQEWLPEVT